MIKRIKRLNTKQARRKIKYLKRHPFVLPVTTFLVLFFLSLAGIVLLGGQTIGAADTKVVLLHVNGEDQVLPTRAETVGDLLNRLNITVSQQDIVEPALDTRITTDNFQINVFTARPVLIDDEGRKQVVLTAEPTPIGVAKEAGLKIYPEDHIEKAPLAAEPLEALNEGVVAERVVIERSTPVFLNLYGKSYSIRTHAETVGELLSQKDVKTLDGDTVQPALDTPIRQNLQIFVIRKGKKVVSQEESIEPPIERHEDAGLDLGVTIVLEPGSPGKRVVTYEIRLENNKEVARKEIQSVVVTEPEVRVVKVGTKRKIFSGSFAAALAALRGCESGGNYSINTGNGYYGAYQYNYSTWNNYAGYAYPHQAPPYVQDQKAWETYQGRGWSPWPACSRGLGLQDIYR